MEDRGQSRVQSHAASAVINFCEHATKPMLTPYLGLLLRQLALLIQSSKRTVQEQVRVDFEKKNKTKGGVLSERGYIGDYSDSSDLGCGRGILLTLL